MNYKNDLEMALKAAIYAIKTSRASVFIDDIKGKNGGPYAIKHETAIEILCEQLEALQGGATE